MIKIRKMSTCPVALFLDISVPSDTTLLTYCRCFTTLYSIIGTPSTISSTRIKIAWKSNFGQCVTFALDSNASSFLSGFLLFTSLVFRISALQSVRFTTCAYIWSICGWINQFLIQIPPTRTCFLTYWKRPFIPILSMSQSNKNQNQNCSCNLHNVFCSTFKKHV